MENSTDRALAPPGGIIGDGSVPDPIDADSPLR
jgi:hypothetical protein